MNKKSTAFTVFVFLCLLMPGQALAQHRFFVGGQLGITSSASQYHSDDRNSTASFSISPEAGLRLKNDKWILGMRLSCSFASSDTGLSISVDDLEMKYGGTTRYNSFGINPFAMYRCFSAGPVEFWLEGGATYEYAFNSGEIPGGKNYLDACIWDISVAPVVTWRPFEHFGFFTELNCLSLGYSYADIISGGQGMTSSSFSLGADSRSFLELSDISIGFRYWFR